MLYSILRFRGCSRSKLEDCSASEPPPPPLTLIPFLFIAASQWPSIPKGQGLCTGCGRKGVRSFVAICRRGVISNDDTMPPALGARVNLSGRALTTQSFSRKRRGLRSQIFGGNIIVRRARGSTAAGPILIDRSTGSHAKLGAVSPWPWKENKHVLSCDHLPSSTFPRYLGSVLQGCMM